jgi:pimeloyl-ACP methyl ester carboxylesterase
MFSQGSQLKTRVLVRTQKNATPMGELNDMSKTIRFWVGVLIGAISLVFATALIVAYRFAWLVLTPPGEKVFDLEILELEYSRGEIVSVTLPLNDDTVLPGQYSLVFARGQGIARLGDVTSVRAHTVQRAVLGVIGVAPVAGMRGRFNGWMFLDPAPLQVSWRTVLLRGISGVLPAWYVAPKRKRGTKSHSKTWAIHVHGRSASRAETLRGVGITASMGWSNLVCSYRNDELARFSGNGRYALGAEEWRDVDVALSHAVQRGASDIVLFGWSMGGAICLQLLEKSQFRNKIRAVVLDSPALDWKNVLSFHAELSRVAPPVTRLGLWLMKRGIVRSGVSGGIPFKQLDALPILSGSQTPVLILHSEDDGYVPFAPSAKLAKQCDHVTLVAYKDARHCKLWNMDPKKYERAVAGWLGQLSSTEDSPAGRADHAPSA